MSDRGRPHNLGQALFEGLGAGLGAYGGFLEQERIRKSQATQQGFLNQLRTDEGRRSQERLDLQRQRDENALIGEASINPNFISDLDQSLIDQRNASAALSRGRLESLGETGAAAGRSMFGVGTGGTIFDELNLGFKQRELGRRLAARDPAFGTQDPETGAFTPGKDIEFDEISTPEDTLRVLLQQARGITGEAPTTTLQGLGKESVFPRADFNELAQQPELQQKRIESRQRAVEWADANLPQWRELSPKDQEKYLQSVEFRLQQ